MDHTKATATWLCLTFGLVSAALPAGAQVDLSVSSIEVTQAIQSIPPTLTLVAQRGTGVRVTIGVSGTGSPVTGVTGRLHIFVDNIEITPPAGLLPINAPMTAPLAPNRDTENHTLNFELPAPSGIGASSNVDVSVDITPVAGEVNTANNSGSLNNLTFAERCTPDLFYTRINFTGDGFPDATKVQPSVGDAFVQGIYPMREDAMNYQPGLFPTLAWNNDPDNDGILDSGAEVSELLDFLESCRQLIVDVGIGASDNKFLYGWIKDNPISGTGWANVGGFVAFGNTQDSRYQRTYAHELSHNFGLSHNTRTLVQTGWDVDSKLPNNPSGNNVTGRVRASTLSDIMVAGLLSNQAWVDPTTYSYFLSHPILDCASDADSGVAVIKGYFTANGLQLLRLRPVFQFPWRSTATPLGPNGRYAARVRDNLGSIQVIRFNARVADDAGPDSAGAFTVMAALPPGRTLQSVRITDSTGTVFYDSLGVSSPPQIDVVSPAPGDSLGPNTLVQWNVNDPDTPAARRMLQIAYSPDDGARWVPVAVNVPGTQSSVLINTTEIEPSSGTGRIRVFVSDGIRTSDGQVGNLTTRSAILGVADRASSRLPMWAWPNPFTVGTRVAFAVSKSELGLVQVYDVAGRLIRTLHAGMLPAGRQSFWWDGQDVYGRRVPAGIYLVIARVGDLTTTSRVVRLR